MGQTASSPAAQPPAACPIKHNAAPDAAAPAKCPIDHTAKSTPADAPAQCPIDHSGSSLDPRNQMPTLSQAPAAHQSIALPVAREESTIPRDDEGRWEYPSPQQFYNALVRKGWETPEEHVEVMVQIHNFLNEQAWQEIVKWEKKENP